MTSDIVFKYFPDLTLQQKQQLLQQHQQLVRQRKQQQQQHQHQINSKEKHTPTPEKNLPMLLEQKEAENREPFNLKWLPRSSVY